MNYNNYNPYTNPNNNQTSFSSNLSSINIYEKVSFGLGIASILTCSIIYLSFITGSLAILFAILSKGGNMKFGSKAKVGFILAIIGFILTIVFYVIAFQFALAQYGSFEGILREACEMIGYDFDSLYSELIPLSL